jgi:alkylation response protein AidB-like acyl-CoA dehydrogenase
MVVPRRTWQTYFPHAAFDPGPVSAIEAILGRAEVQAELEDDDRQRRFPERLIGELRTAGLAEVLVGWDGEAPTATPLHVYSMNAIAAQASGSLAITLGVNCLALLPACVAATADQLGDIQRRVRGGAFVALLLTEWEAGSNLLGTATRAVAADGDGGRVYRVDGEKQLINLADRAELLMTLVRTAPPTSTTGLGATAGLTVLAIGRDSTVESLPRWHTAPAPAAEIGGVRFTGTAVAERHRIGGEGEGFGVIQRTLTISRGGVGAVAAGASNRAVRLAFEHALGRVLYGAPIASLEIIADHLIRMAAFDLGATCLAQRTAAAVNLLGIRASHQTAIAKLACCDLAEAAVTEGRIVVSARALLEALPYQQVARDVWLYGVFDGTRHVMLDQIQHRLRQIGRTDRADDALAELYRAPVRSMPAAARTRGMPWLARPSGTLARLAELPGAVDLEPLRAAALALEAVSRDLPDERWQSQAVSFALAESLAGLEAAIAVAELADPQRRVARGARPLAGDDPALPAADLAAFAVAALGGRAASRLQRVAHGAGLELSLEPIVRALARDEERAGRRLRAAVRDSN